MRCGSWGQCGKYIGHYRTLAAWQRAPNADLKIVVRGSVHRGSACSWGGVWNIHLPIHSDRLMAVFFGSCHSFPGWWWNNCTTCHIVNFFWVPNSVLAAGWDITITAGSETTGVRAQNVEVLFWVIKVNVDRSGLWNLCKPFFSIFPPSCYSLSIF